MGFFKDVATLNKMGKELRKDWDPVAQMQQAQASMAQMNATLVDMTARSSAAAAPNRTSTTATVTGARQTGQYMNMQPVVAIDLLVTMPGGIPSPVTITEVVAPLMVSRIQTGGVLGVSVGAVPTDVIIDWHR